MAVSTLGTLSYGTLAFGPYERSSVSTEMVRDEAQRTVIACRITIDVRAWVQDDSGTDSDMQTILTTLSKDGLPLHYDNGRGFGGPTGTGLAVNVSGGQVWDADWGPKPTLIDFTPYGGGRTALVEWKVSTLIPLCGTSAAYVKQLMAFNFDQEWVMHDNGLQDIKTQGYLEIPLTWQDGRGRGLNDNADAYREKITAAIPNGFRRRDRRYHLSKNRRKLDFGWVDSEMDFPLPNNICLATIQHSTSWNVASAAIMVNQITGELTAAPDVDKSVVLDRWKSIVASRIRTAQKAGAMQVGVGKALQGIKGAAGAAGKAAAFVGAVGFGMAAQAQPTAMLTATAITEDVLTRTTRFATNYSLIGATLPMLLQASGLFKQIDGTDFQKWAGTMSNSVHHPRGWARGKFDQTSDFIIDLCVVSKPQAPEGTSKPAFDDAKLAEQLGWVAPPVAVAPPFGVDPKSSWVAYVCDTNLSENDRVVIHKPLTTGTKDDSPNKPSTSRQSMPPDVDVGVEGKVADIVQHVGSPTYTVVLTGRALRLAHRVPIPRLKSVGGVDVVQTRQDSREGILEAVAGVPIYYKTWRVEYEVPSTPQTNMPIAGNPALQVADEIQ